MAEAPGSNFITVFEDSRRWRNIVRRAGDIVISTPPKSGTTWMQGIVTALLWPDGDAPGTRGELSPWVDVRLTPIDDLVARLDQQQHRRYLKTHSPGDCIPFDSQCQYIVVYRDGRDSLVSWGNHRAAMRPAIVGLLNTEAAKHRVAPIDERWDGDYDTLFDEWQMTGSPVRHLASWWPRRHEPNVLFVHYNDLSADLEGEMHRIADFLDLGVTESQLPKAVDRCRLDSMRSEAEAHGGLDGVFDGGASAFYFKGTNGRWRDILSDEQVARYLALVADDLPEDAASWLEHGSLSLGIRPDAIGMASHSTLDTSAFHPVFSRLGVPRPTNSLDAIADRRVSEAREAGLFDDLRLHGKPIPDIDRPRQPGWWANQFVARERNKVTALELEAEVRRAMAALWRLTDAAQVIDRVHELNGIIDRYNQVTTLAPMSRLAEQDVVTKWRQLKNR